MDNGSLLRPDHLRQVNRLHDFIVNRMHFTYHMHNHTFSELCTKLMRRCSSGYEIVNMLKVLEHPQPGHYIDYPNSKWDSTAEHSIGLIAYDIGIKPNANNDTVRLTRIGTIALNFRAFVNESEFNMAKEWEMALHAMDYGSGDLDSMFPLLNINTAGDMMLNHEVTMAGHVLAKYFVLGFLLMTAFVFTSVVGMAKYHGVLRCAQLYIGLGAIVTPFLSFIMTFGAVAYSDMTFYSMMMLAPYLILAIGVDDAFLMMHAWHRLAHARYETDIKRRSALRLGKVLEDVGPSITVTSLTNALAFGIGALTDTPVIQNFCITTAIAMGLCYIFMLTFFSPILVLVGRSDPIPPLPVASDIDDVNNTNLLERQIGDGLQMTISHRVSQSAATTYAKVISCWPSIILILCGTAAIWTTMVTGAYQIRTVVDIEQILPRDTALLSAFKIVEHTLWTQFYPVQVIVNRPPRLPNDTQYNQFYEMIDQFENKTRGSQGPPFTFLWLRTYEHFVDKFSKFDLLNWFGSDDYEQTSNGIQLGYDNVPEFVSLAPVLANLVHYRADGEQVDVQAFTFLVGYANASTWASRVNYMLEWRAIAARYADSFNVSVWSPMGLQCDAIMNLATIATETVSITLGVMAFICLLFIPSLCGVICASVAIASTTLCVIGSLYYWGIALDPISVSAVLMAIGFSVDFTAHTSYHFQKSLFDYEPGCESKAGRLAYTLESVAFPMFQAGTSTILCVVPLGLHQDYAPQVLFKAIISLVVWGWLHGLVILPVLLAAMPNCFIVSPIESESDREGESQLLAPLARPDDTKRDTH